MSRPKRNAAPPQDGPITPAQIQDALHRSGYLLETRLEALLHKSEWKPEANIGIPDPKTHKSRELDLAATRHFLIPKDEGSVTARLLIECVNNPQPIAFFAAQAQDPMRNAANFSLLSKPRYILGGKHGTMSLADAADLASYHHYAGQRVATQFCTFVEKKDGTGEWMAKHEDRDYDSFLKLSMAVNESGRSWAKAIRQIVSPVAVGIYPIVVVQGKLLEVTVSDLGATFRETDHAAFVHKVATPDISYVYHYDVVTEKCFPTLLETISEESFKLLEYLMENFALVRREGLREEAEYAVAKAKRDEARRPRFG